MNHKQAWAFIVTMAVLLLGTSRAAGQQGEPVPQGIYDYAFTYQGQLRDAGGPVNGTCDLSFALWDAGSGGTQVGSTLSVEAVALADGLFSARLDFGSVHSGAAHWLEIAVRCPAGSGDYTTLSPRQELTGSPAALSLALPFLAEADLGGPLLWIENNGAGEAAGFESVGGIALWVEAPASEGVHVATAGQDGVHVVNAGGHGLAVDAAGSNGVFVNSAGFSGLAVDSAGSDGLFVGSAGDDGVHVGSAGFRGVYVDSANSDGIHVVSAGDDGVYVHHAGNPSTTLISDAPNGLEVAGAEGNGLFIGRADSLGVYVMGAGEEGMYVGHSGKDGIYVFQAGDSSSWTYSGYNNGYEVAGAEGYGLYVGRADLDGVYIHSAAWHGLNVAGASVNGVYVVNTGNDGLYVGNTGDDGVDVTGTDYAGVFTGDIYVSGDCIGCTMAAFGLNASDRPLEPGQVVAIQGFQSTTLDNAPTLWRVVLAQEGLAAVGVVRGRAELDEALKGMPLRDSESGRRLVPRGGAAQPGQYLSIVIYGPMQVQAGTAAGPIQPGTRLAAGETGTVRALKTIIVEGVALAESVPVLGVALAAPDEDGLVWVLVNPQ